jgi:phage terminase small subunit
MGRRPDDPRDQRLKGYPGRRKGKTDAQIAALDEAEQLLAAMPPGADTPPAYLDAPEAQAIWREHGPRLERLHVLSVLDHHAFAMFCVYAGAISDKRAAIARRSSFVIGTACSGRTCFSRCRMVSTSERGLMRACWRSMNRGSSAPTVSAA